jgi:G3E family GTPase
VVSWCWENNALKHVLENRDEMRVAVIVNDMSEIIIDAAFLRGFWPVSLP